MARNTEENSGQAAEQKSSPDWIAIEVDYRAGIKPLRQMGEEHGISHVAISKRAKRDGWARDLAAKIKSKAEEKVNKAAVNASVNAQRVATETQVVEANAELQYRVRMEHREDVGRTRTLFRSLLEELEVASSTDGARMIEELFTILDPAIDNESPEEAKRREARQRKMLARVLETPDRIDSFKKLTETLERVIRMEREAFGIKDDAGASNTVDDLLRQVAAMAGQ